MDISTLALALWHPHRRHAPPLRAPCKLARPATEVQVTLSQHLKTNKPITSEKKDCGPAKTLWAAHVWPRWMLPSDEIVAQTADGIYQHVGTSVNKEKRMYVARRYGWAGRSSEGRTGDSTQLAFRQRTSNMRVLGWARVGRRGSKGSVQCNFTGFLIRPSAVSAAFAWVCGATVLGTGSWEVLEQQSRRRNGALLRPVSWCCSRLHPRQAVPYPQPGARALIE